MNSLSRAVRRAAERQNPDWMLLGDYWAVIAVAAGERLGWPDEILSVLAIEPYFVLADPFVVDAGLAGETDWAPGADTVVCAVDAGVLPDDGIRRHVELAQSLGDDGEAARTASDRAQLQAVCFVLASLLEADRRFETESTPLYDELLRSFPGFRPHLARALADVWPLIQPVRG